MNLPDTSSPTRLYNDNRGAVDWAKGTTTKRMRHINLRDCAIRDSIQAKEVDLSHIPGDINPSDIFTKELRDASRFRTLRDSFMMSAEKFRAFVASSSVWMSASWVSGLRMVSPTA